MQISEWISLLSSVGAMSAAITGLFTLLELSKQRRSSYKPDVCVIGRSFDMRSYEFGEEKIALNWHDEENAEVDSILQPRLKMVNVGFAAAKNVTCEWLFDLENILDRVNQLAQETHSGFFIERNDNMLSINHTGEEVYMVMHREERVVAKYVLPVSQDGATKEIGLPAAYTLLVSAYMSLMVRAEQSFEDYELPELKLKLKYFDIGGGMHSTIHNLTAKIRSISTRQGDKKHAEFSIYMDEN